MTSECLRVKKLFKELCAQLEYSFPQARKPVEAPSKPGVYIIRKDKAVLHVGRTLRGKGGLFQRLMDHLHGASSFTNEYLNGRGATLRKKGYTYQFLALNNPRVRAFLEAYAVGTLCPKHIGLGALHNKSPHRTRTRR